MTVRRIGHHYVQACWLLLLVSLLWTLSASSQPPPSVDVGDRVVDVLEAYRAQGEAIAYSPALVSDALTVSRVPAALDSGAFLSAILSDHGLALQTVDGLHIVVRQETDAAAARDASLLVVVASADAANAVVGASVTLNDGSVQPQMLSDSYRRFASLEPDNYLVQVSAPGFVPQTRRLTLEPGANDVLRFELALAPLSMPAMEVSVSRYELLRERLGSASLISQRSITHLPDIGDDPIRAVRRLPGTAAGTNSAKSFIRGAEANDTDIYLNGQRLLDPFHIRNYQSLFSTIDVRAVDGIEVFTGGFPVRYGDRLGGLILVDTATPAAPRRHELGLSVFNSSLLSSGTLAEGKGKWLLSARRGNLDLVIDDRFGQPSYNDVFAELGYRFGDSTTLSLNGLVANDRANIVIESNPDDQERSSSDVRNAQFWVNWAQHWRPDIQSHTTLSVSKLRSTRTGFVNDPEKIVGQLDDRRDVDLFGVRQDWQFELTDQHRLHAGVELEHRRASYDYQSEAAYFGAFALLGVRDPVQQTDINTTVDGDYLSLYLSNTVTLGDATVADIGFRWDKQTYTDAGNERQFSPRFSLLHSFSPQTDLRLSWGRFWQSQGIHDLQVEDGVERFFPARRADHAIVSLRHRLSRHYSVRLEAYTKAMGQQRPRFENFLDPLAALPELAPDRVAIAADGARAHGVELSLAYDGPADVSWWATYTNARTVDDIDGETFPRSWDQRDAFHFGIDYSRGRLDLGMVASYHSGWPRTHLSLVENPAPGESPLAVGRRNAERFRSFVSLDLRAGYRWPLRHGQLNAFVEVSNATNRDNPCCVDFDLEVDDAGMIQLDQSQEFWLPLLPAIGVLWEF